MVFVLEIVNEMMVGEKASDRAVIKVARLSGYFRFVKMSLLLKYVVVGLDFIKWKIRYSMVYFRNDVNFENEVLSMFKCNVFGEENEVFLSTDVVVVLFFFGWLLMKRCKVFNKYVDVSGEIKGNFLGFIVMIKECVMNVVGWA